MSAKTLITVLLAALALATTAAGQAPPPAGSGTGTPPAGGEQPQLTVDQVLRRVRDIRDAATALRGTQRGAALVQEAASALSMVLQSDPKNIEANLLMGELLVLANDFDRARMFFSTVLQTEPSNFRANYGLGRIWLANQYWRQAQPFLEQAEKVAPEDNTADVKSLLAMVYGQLGQAPEALKKAGEAVAAGPENLDALRMLIQVRSDLVARDPSQLEQILGDTEKLVQLAHKELQKQPWNRDALTRLNDSYQMKVSSLQAFHATFYQKNARGQATDQLLPGKGPLAAAVLYRVVEALRVQSLIRLIFSEQDALLLGQQAVSDPFDPNNVTYLEGLLATYQQLYSLTARLVGDAVDRDTTVLDQAVAVARRILERAPENAAARRYLDAVGAPLTTQPAEAPAEAPPADPAAGG